MKLDERVDAADLKTLAGFTPDEMLTDLDEIADRKTVSLRDLYHRWERQAWSAYALDFSTDVRDWEAMGTDVTERLLWVMTMFFHGEECVTQTLAPWVSSAPTEEVQIFLATQLSDEARHTVFFDRFFEEVVGASGDLRERLDASRPRLNDGFNTLFYEMLPRIAKEVGDNPGDPVVFARGVAMYHILLEGALAVPGQKYILAFCRDRDVLPAFRSGFTAVARDESRHVGAGVRILRALIAAEPACAEAAQDLVREALPYATQQFQPPGGDFSYLSVLGYDSTELFRFGLHSLAKRLTAAGVPFPRTEPMRLPPVDREPVLPERPLTPIQQMLQPMRDQLTTQMVFQGLPMVFNPQAARDIDEAYYRFDITGEGGGTWTVAVVNGACEIIEGPPPKQADWRLEMDTGTWLAMATGDILGQEAFLLGKITVEGNAIVGTRFDELFRPPAST